MRRWIKGLVVALALMAAPVWAAQVSGPLANYQEPNPFQPYGCTLGATCINTDLNSIFSALVTNSSGATAPVSPQPWQFWVNTSTGMLEQWNPTTGQWLNILSAGVLGGNASQFLGGDVTPNGTNSLKVIGLQGLPVSPITPSGSQCLVYSSTTGWTPEACPQGSIPGGLTAVLNANGYAIYGLPAASSSYANMPVIAGANNNVAGTQINGLAGSGATNGSDSITELNRPDAIYAETYGAKGDGTTDDGPAIRAAMVAACTGGKPCAVALLPGHTYYVNSMGGYDGQCGVYFPNSGEKLYAYGATLKAGTSITHSLVCFYPDTSTAQHGGWESATSYLVNAAVNRGATSLTLSTASNASHFTAGDVVFMRGYDASDSNDAMGVNIVTSVNATTGVLTFAWPWRKTYGAETSTYPVIADVQSALVSDIGLYGGTLQLTTEPGYALNMGEFHRGTIRDVVIQGASTDGYDDFSGIDLLDLVMDHVTSTQPCASPFNGASRGMTDVRVTNSVFEANGVCGASPGLFVMAGTGEGVEGFKYDNDYFYDDTGYMEVQFGPSSDVLMTGSTILEAGGLNNASGRLVNSGFFDWGPYDLRITSNVIIEAGTATPASGSFILNLAGSNDWAADNKIYIYGATGSGNPLQLGEGVPVTFTDNYIYLGTAPTSAALVGGILNLIENNSFSGTTAPICIDVADPGSVSSSPLWIKDNNLTTCTTPIAYAAVAHVPNRIVEGNTGVGDYTPNALTSGLVTASLANTCSQDVVLSSGSGTFTNSCVNTGSHCDAKDITTATNSCTVAAPAAGSIAITGTGSDTCRTWCQ